MELLGAVESPNKSYYLYRWKAQSKLYKVKFVRKGLDKPKKKKTTKKKQQKTVINLINRCCSRSLPRGKIKSGRKGLSLFPCNGNLIYIQTHWKKKENI